MKKKLAGATMTPDLRNKKIETYKLVFDLMKHITTLSSGSILLLITLMEKVFRDNSPSFFLYAAFFVFCASILGAIIAMMGLAFTASEGEMTDKERNTFVGAAVVSVTSFGIGITFSVFAFIPPLT